MTANADYYPTAKLRIAYVTSRCKGDAHRHISPRLETQDYRDFGEILNHLKGVFVDPNKARNARRTFNTIKMANFKDYHTFASEFQYLAVEGQIDRETWKESFFHALPDEVQRMVAYAFNDDNRTLGNLTHECAKVADLWADINKRRSNRNAARGGSKPSTPNKSSSLRAGTPIKSEERPVKKGGQVPYLSHSIQLATNGYSVSTHALIDTEANGLSFLNHDLAILLAKRFNLHTIPLPNSVPIKGYNGSKGGDITHAIILTLIIDQRTQKLPFLIVDLGQNDVILGRKWLQENTERALCRIERALKEAQGDPEPALERPPKAAKKDLPEVDIFAISGSAYQLPLGRSDCFITSLAQIDKIIDEKTYPKRQLEVEKLKEQIPEAYHSFVDVFLKSALDALPPRRENDHQIELTDKNTLGYSPLYRYSTKELEAIKAYMVENLQKGFIVPSAAPFGSPVLMAAKPGGGLRFCMDYRKLDSITKKNRYPLPLMDELLDRLGRAKIFTYQARHQAGLLPHTNAPRFSGSHHVSHQLMNDIFIDLIDKYVAVYVDDILIFSEDELEQEAHVQEVLKRHRAAGLQAAIHKCEFNVKRTKFLGFIPTMDGIEVDPEKIAVITNWQVPTTVRGVQSFLGFCNFYRRFIEAYSRIARLLYALTKKLSSFEWTSSYQEAFEQLKKYLTSAPLLRHHDPTLPSGIETEASNCVIAGIFSQLFEGRWHPIAYFSRDMLGAERNYDIHDKELWRTELEGLQITERIEIWTDYRALEYFMTTKKLNGRQARWSEFLSRFHFLIKFRLGLKNTAADALSRPEESPLDLDAKNQALLRPE
ncbi:pol polyprotein [Aspergillus affinis]|uniref:pol polyprotein n=1 Tax=Aspergillus affinis TaxID=1070780 RepID=UPI0022FEAC7F|nr:uncharacterized protein KD926_002624 [Aspergillus affinis]KAI9035908.1 hypothetical protein KD926_002624 [Aspergillus affinis]